MRSSAAERIIPTRAELLARAEALAPVLRLRSPKAEEMRRCPEQSIADFAEQGFLKICQPARFGGYELGWDVLAEVVMVLARGCASQAWMVHISNDHAQQLGTFDARAQEEVWGGNPEARLCGSLGPTATGRAVPGGAVFSGIHHYASGIDSADWAICGARLSEGDAPPRTVYYVIPRADWTIIDDWRVMGLAGTGSKSCEVREAFVPTHRIAAGETLWNGSGLGLAVNKAPVFRLPRRDLASSSFAAVALGVAQGFLADYVAYTKDRVSHAGKVADLGSTHIRIGAAFATLDSAMRANMGAVREAMETLERGEAISAEQGLRAKLICCNAAHEAHRVVLDLFQPAGSGAIFEDNPMQRSLRDIHAVLSHFTFNFDGAAAAYGKVMLGLE